jgi:hypothetical protein
MILILIALGLALVIFGLNYWAVKDDYSLDVGDFIISIFFGFVFLCFVIAIPIGVYSSKVQIAGFESVKETVDQQRSLKKTDYERVMLTEKIVNQNMLLERMKAKKTMLWTNWYITKDVLDVEPIK